MSNHQALDLTELDEDQLYRLILEARKRLYPVAEIDGAGKLVCPHCQAPQDANLVEIGYEVTHGLRILSQTKIEVCGWDGRSTYVSEDGEMLTLECQGCLNKFRISENAEVEWV